MQITVEAGELAHSHVGAKIRFPYTDPSTPGIDLVVTGTVRSLGIYSGTVRVALDPGQIRTVMRDGALEEFQLEPLTLVEVLDGGDNA